MPKAPQNLKDIRSLVEVVAALRGPGGCPWDLEQTHRTLARYALEEVHEMVESLEEREDLRPPGDQSQSPGRRAGTSENKGAFVLATQKFKEELGDVLFQVVLHAQLASEEGSFDFEAVVETLAQKLIRRHPHVFGDVKVNGTADVFANWEQIKKAEKAARGEKGPLISVPAALPALQRAFAIGEKTHKMKFDWQGPAEVWLKVEEEVAELQEAMDNDVMSEIEHEIGDVLFSVAQLARHYDLDPEQVLRTANTRFLGRFEKMIGVYAGSVAGQTPPPISGKALEEVLTSFAALSTEEKESFWREAKKL
jgi:tetrapyrrole methylase family protein/MazG family protein